jgi:hypothetical protein
MLNVIFSLVLLAAAAPAVLAASPEAVQFDVHVILSGNLAASTTSGFFVASGAVTDAGTEAGAGWFAGEGHLKTGEPNSLHTYVTLTGSDGTVTIDLRGLFGQLPAPTATGSGVWVVSAGTGAYADLHARGTWTGFADFRAAIAQLGPPTVDLALEGMAN